MGKFTIHFDRFLFLVFVVFPDTLSLSVPLKNNLNLKSNLYENKGGYKVEVLERMKYSSMNSKIYRWFVQTSGFCLGETTVFTIHASVKNIYKKAVKNSVRLILKLCNENSSFVDNA